MSRREKQLQATVTALQPKGLDLTQFAPPNSVYARNRLAANVRAMRVAADEAAGALAFASMDRYEDEAGNPVPAGTPGAIRLPGDDFPVALLRLKKARHPSRELFTYAHLTLVLRHGGIDRRRTASETLYAVAWGALCEWLHDECPICREHHAGQPQPAPCPVCRPRKVEDRAPFRRDTVQLERDGKKFDRPKASISPTIGCPKCKGLGRIFQEQPRPRGMNCVPCRNSGRVTFKPKRRWRMVNEFLIEAQRARGEPARGLSLSAWDHWHRRYWTFIDVLRGIENRLMGGDLDFGERASSRDVERLDAPFAEDDNPAIESGTEEKQDDDSPIERDVAPCPTSHEPAEPTGELPPQDS